MKIIKVDNYDREIYDDVLIAENINESYGNIIIKFLNSDPTRYDGDYFRLVEDKYKLFERDY